MEVKGHISEATINTFNANSAIDNTVAEQTVKPFAICGKIWLFDASYQSGKAGPGGFPLKGGDLGIDLASAGFTTRATKDKFTYRSIPNNLVICY